MVLAIEGLAGDCDAGGHSHTAVGHHRPAGILSIGEGRTQNVFLNAEGKVVSGGCRGEIGGKLVIGDRYDFSNIFYDLRQYSSVLILG